MKKKRPHRQIKAEEYVEAIKQARGLVSVAAARLGCSTQAVYNARDRYATVRQALKEAREAMGDHAEARLFQQIDEGNTTALIFYLKCLHKARGYVERQEITGPDGGPIAVKGYISVNPDEWPDSDDENSADG